MDRSIINELTATVVALRAAGQIGFWILLIVLLVAIGLAIAALLYHRMVIGRYAETTKATEAMLKGVENNIKSVESNIKSVETNIKERELGVKEREELRNIFTQQFTVVKDANSELRAEMSRLREQQKGIKDSLNQTITAGLHDIRDRIAQTSLKEITAQIPESFRQELTVQFQEAVRLSSERLTEQFQSDAVLKKELDGVFRDLSERLRAELERLPLRHLGSMQMMGGFIFDAVLEESGSSELAHRVLRRLRY